MATAAAHDTHTGTGLTALVIYRRPASRRELLGQLADLGMFVVEHPGENGWTAVANSTGADVVVLVAGSETDAILAADLASRRPVVVCVAEGAAKRPYFDAGVHVCVTDSELMASAPRLLAGAAMAARRGRGTWGPSLSVAVGSATFDPAVPSLEGAGRTVVLSRSERATLLRLVEAHGHPVATAELGRIASPAGHAMRPGFPKATILRLRKKLDIVGTSPRTIRTVRGVGYALLTEAPSSAVADFAVSRGKVTREV